jgi:acetyl esterase/lipase
MNMNIRLYPLIMIILCGQALAQPRGAGVFQRFDRDEDGRLSREEVDGTPLESRLSAADRDEDGFISAAEFAEAMRKTRQTLGQQSPVIREDVALVKHADLRYTDVQGVEATFHSLDVYAPKGARKAPVIVFIHGGGWRAGDKGNRTTGENLAQRYGAEGFVVVSVNYRLTPAGKHPANIRDVAKAVAWTHDHITQYGGDPARMSIMGHSAGGHLAALVAADERWLRAEGKPLSILRRAVLLDPAAYDVPRFMSEFARGDGDLGMKRLYLNAFGENEAAWRDASPRRNLTANTPIPPMLIFYTGARMAANVLAPDFADALTKAGAASRAVDTVTLEHSEILSYAAVKEHPIATLTLRFLLGEEAGRLPDRLDARVVPPASSVLEPDRRMRNSSAVSSQPPIEFQFTQDYVPGQPDRNDVFTTGTELNYLVAHEGRLWASVSCWNLDGNGPNPGTHILVKEAADQPWRVDHLFGTSTVRAEFLTVLTFTTDHRGQRLDPPVKMLAAGIASRQRPLKTEVCLRDPDSGRWIRSTVTTTTERGDGHIQVGVRVLHDHVDSVKGVHHVFAGATVGEIVRGSYDPGVPGRIVWDSASELPARESRIHAMEEVDGVLYASVGSDVDTA